MKAYKIRIKDTGLYSLGGTTPKFNKSGKVWNSLGSLKNHLRLVNRQVYHPFKKIYIKSPWAYDPAVHEIVQLEIVETIIGLDEFQDISYGKDGTR